MCPWWFSQFAPHSRHVHDHHDEHPYWRLHQHHILTYLWISPSIAPKLTLNVTWCFREDQRGHGRCWRSAAGRLSCLHSCWSDRELDERQTAATVWGFAFWSNAGSAGSCGSCVRSFFRRHDNWGLRRTTRIPPGHRILKKIIKIIINKHSQ